MDTRRVAGLIAGTLVALWSGGCTLPGTPTPEPGAESSDRFVPLFDGGTLEGWVQRGGRAAYRVEDGAIVGSTRPHEPNSFLCTVEEYDDFVLELEFRVDAGLNSGVQFRSHWRQEGVLERVHGYQAEIDPSERGWTAGIYDEGGRGWLASVPDDSPARGSFKSGFWNRMRIEARGDHLRTWLNGVPAADLVDRGSARGFIALQVHAVGDKAEPMEVRWREIRLRRLPSGRGAPAIQSR